MTHGLGVRGWLALVAATLLVVAGWGTIPASADWEVEVPTPGVLSVPYGFSPQDVTIAVEGLNETYGEWAPLMTVAADAKGRFEIPSLSGWDSYRATFVAPGLRWVAADVWGDPLSVTMEVGGGTISGTADPGEGWPFSVEVIGVSGEAAGTVRKVRDLWGPSDYAVHGLLPGGYVVHFPSTAQVEPEYWPDARSEEDAEVIQVEHGSVVTGIDVVLDRYALIFGTLGGADGSAISDAKVEILELTPSGELVVPEKPYVDLRWTGFSISQVPAGRYVLRFSAPGLATEYYDDAGSPERAQVLDVDYYDVIEGIDAVLTADGPPRPPDPAPRKVALVKAPKVSGKARVGKTLRVSKGTWKPGKVTLKHQWFVKKGKKFVAVKKATKPSLKLTRAMKGKRVRVRVTARAKGHTAYVFSSRWTRRVRT